MKYICQLVDGRYLSFDHKTGISFSKMTIKFIVGHNKAIKHHTRKLYQSKTGVFFFIFNNNRFHFSDFDDNFD